MIAVSQTTSNLLFFLIIVSAIIVIYYNVSRRLREKDKQLAHYVEEIIISEERYRILQESLNHFSQDLFKVMEISDLENRFMLELTQVLKLDGLYIIEIDDQLNLYRSTRGSAQSHSFILKDYNVESLIGELVTADQGGYVKIGESNGHTILLIIEDDKKIAELLPPQRIWLQTISRYVSVLYENLFTIEDLASELEERMQDKSTPKWILRLLFQVAEKERMRLSADLHDSVLQNLIIHYRQVDSLFMNKELPAEFKQDVTLVKQGILETIKQIRVTCNYLRPPYLKEQGLIKAIESLVANTRFHVDFTIHFDYTGLKHELNEEEILSLYRITQELLANAQKHSQSTQVELTVSSLDEKIYFIYQDNGVGFDTEIQVNTFEHIGLSGMRKRIDSIGGEVEIYSAIGKGVNVLITLPAGKKNVQSNSFLEVF
ncbi:sensor histidine kinase [Bacillus sp. ISL-18]|uniref:sensor histidine kinase n=1 Tax=Bacillus sp. ISL-18 TaxID=2819118 RepID=UPI001BEBC44C|nr:sensor histidine kinase [Bacillus sp. ISL-18]MBT2657847.1 sensor histidine kinase [Bacillus sp. ISL-18]